MQWLEEVRVTPGMRVPLTATHDSYGISFSRGRPAASDIPHAPAPAATAAIAAADATVDATAGSATNAAASATAADATDPAATVAIDRPATVAVAVLGDKQPNPPTSVTAPDEADDVAVADEGPTSIAAAQATASVDHCHRVEHGCMQETQPSAMAAADQAAPAKAFSGNGAFHETASPARTAEPKEMQEPCQMTADPTSTTCIPLQVNPCTSWWKNFGNSNFQVILMISIGNNIASVQICANP